MAGGVPRLAGGVRIGVEDGVDGLLEGAEDGSGAWLGEGVRLRLRLGQGFVNGLGGVAELLGDLADGEAVASGLPDLCEVAHREHPFPLGGRG